MARTQKWTLVGDDATYGGFTVYGRIENWNYFVKTDIDFSSVACPETTTKQSGPVKDYKRKRHPLDTNPYTVPAQPDGRKIFSNASKRSGGALPGKTITFATNPDTWDGGDEERAFQFVGNIGDLLMYLEGDAEKDIIVTTNTGTNYLICAAEAQGGG
tara:strand:- start:51 stop:524 length:474 start_codon:yes stop_codon:yes gene_type:complete